jgi:hypothetical protein
VCQTTARSEADVNTGQYLEQNTGHNTWIDVFPTDRLISEFDSVLVDPNQHDKVV